MPAIDREKLLSDIEKEIEFFSSSPGNHDYFDYAKKNGLVIAKQIVGRQPTIEAEPVRHGRWKKKNGEIYCTNCKKSRWSESFELMLRGFDFCPKCGARMDGGADNG